MTISLRPNKRASRENAPAPRHMMATAMTAYNAAARGVTTAMGWEAGNQEKILAMPAAAAASATNRVRKPMSNKNPTAPANIKAARSRLPISCPSVRQPSPWMRITAPVAKRKSKSPTPGQPSGNIENI